MIGRNFEDLPPEIKAIWNLDDFESVDQICYMLMYGDYESREEEDMFIAMDWYEKLAPRLVKLAKTEDERKMAELCVKEQKRMKQTLKTHPRWVALEKTMRETGKWK